MQVEKIKDLIPEWADIKDVFYDDNYNSDKAIIILLKDKNITGLKSINGRELLTFLTLSQNNDDFNFNETYSWEYIFESEKWTKDKYILNFRIRHGYLIDGNKIEINDKGKINIFLEEPFDGCGAEDELEPIILIHIKEKGVL